MRDYLCLYKIMETPVIMMLTIIAKVQKATSPLDAASYTSQNLCMNYKTFATMNIRTKAVIPAISLGEYASSNINYIHPIIRKTHPTKNNATEQINIFFEYSTKRMADISEADLDIESFLFEKTKESLYLPSASVCKNKHAKEVQIPNKKINAERFIDSDCDIKYTLKSPALFKAGAYQYTLDLCLNSSRVILIILSSDMNSILSNFMIFYTPYCCFVSKLHCPWSFFHFRVDSKYASISERFQNNLLPIFIGFGNTPSSTQLSTVFLEILKIFIMSSGVNNSSIFWPIQINNVIARNFLKVN